MLKEQAEGKNSQFLYDCNTDWNLNVEFVYWLRYWMQEYLKEAGKMVDLTYHEFEYKGREYTQEQVIKEIIRQCDKFIDNDPYIEEDEEAVDAIFALFRLVFTAMWW